MHRDLQLFNEIFQVKKNNNSFKKQKVRSNDRNVKQSAYGNM
jgi:hypothetical protein